MTTQPTTQPILYPDVRVGLADEDPRDFAIINRVVHALNSHGEREAACEFRRKAAELRSYRELLALVHDTVSVDSGHDEPRWLVSG